MIDRPDSIPTDPVREAWERSRLASVQDCSGPISSDAVQFEFGIKDVPRAVGVGVVIAGTAAKDFVTDRVDFTAIRAKVGPTEAALIGGIGVGSVAILPRIPKTLRVVAIVTSAGLLATGAGILHQTLNGNQS